MTDMSRRGLLGFMLAAPAVMQVAKPMRLFVERPRVIAPQHGLLTINMITKEAVRLWQNNNAFLQICDERDFTAAGMQIGQTLRIRLPSNYDGMRLNALS